MNGGARAQTVAKTARIAAMPNGMARMRASGG